MRAEFREYNLGLLRVGPKAMQITMLTMMVSRVTMVFTPKAWKVVKFYDL